MRHATLFIQVRVGLIPLAETNRIGSETATSPLRSSSVIVDISTSTIRITCPSPIRTPSSAMKTSTFIIYTLTFSVRLVIMSSVLILTILTDAQHSPENSTFDDSWDQDGFTDNRVQMTIVDRILKEYLPELMTRGAHIVASVPIYKTTAMPAFYRLTNMTFRTYTAADISSSGADAESLRREQILFVLGMTGNGVCPRTKIFKPSTRWVVHARAGFSHGTFAISRNTFHLRLHSLLARVNALTTLVPVSPSYDGMAGGRDIVQQWAKHKDFSSQPCDWKAVDSEDNLTADKFEWQYTREWNMSEEGTRLAVRGNYFVSCEFQATWVCLLDLCGC